jgi:hypothetical protein
MVRALDDFLDCDIRLARIQELHDFIQLLRLCDHEEEVFYRDQIDILDAGLLDQILYPLVLGITSSYYLMSGKKCTTHFR